MQYTVKCAFLLRSGALKRSLNEQRRVNLERTADTSSLIFSSVLFSTSREMEIIKSIKTWKKPLKRSKNKGQAQNAASSSTNSVSDSADNYCYERRSQTSLESEHTNSGLYSPAASRPSSQPLYSRPPISKPPADFLQPKLYQGKDSIAKKVVLCCYIQRGKNFADTGFLLVCDILLLIFVKEMLLPNTNNAPFCGLPFISDMKLILGKSGKVRRYVILLIKCVRKCYVMLAKAKSAFLHIFLDFYNGKKGLL